MIIRNLLKVALLGSLIAAPIANAATITLDSVGIDRGAFHSSAWKDNFFGPGTWKFAPDTPGVISVRGLGNGAAANEVMRMYHIFDLSGIDPDTIVSATLQIPHSNISYTSSNGAAGAGDATETVGFFDVSTSVDELRNPNESLGNAWLDTIFDDLGTGTEYGNFTASAASNGTTESIALNVDAIADLNAAAGGEWAIGAALLSINLSAFGAEEQVFKGSELAPYFSTASQLVVTTVPIPAAAWLFGSALLGLVGVARRRSSREVNG